MKLYEKFQVILKNKRTPKVLIYIRMILNYTLHNTSIITLKRHVRWQTG